MILEEITAVKVEVFNPETPFGGVQVFGVSDQPAQIEINTGSPVQSVFGRIGHVHAAFQDYDQFYAPLAAAVPPGGLNGQVLTKDSNQSYDLKWGSPTGEGGLPSGGTTGQLLAKIDATPYNAAWVTALYAPLGSELPTGGTTGQILAKIDGTNYNATWVTALYAPLGSQLPTGGTAGQVLSKIDATNYNAQWINPPASGVTSVFTRTGAVVALVGDYSAFYQPLDSDLTSIAALTTTAFGRGFLPLADAAAARTYIGAGTSSFTQANADALYAPIAHTHTFASLTSKPTTLSGYGITDAQPLDSDLTSIAALTTTAYGRGFLPLADAAAARTYIGAQASGAYLTANQPISLTGDVTGGPAATSIATTIGANKVTLGMMATVATGRLLGRTTAAAGNVESLLALPWADTGDVTRPVDSKVFTYTNAVPMAKAGVPTGGTAGQVLSKIDGTNYNLQWINPVTGGGGDVFGPAASVDNELTLFSGTTGKTIKRATTTGILKATSGVIGAAVAGTDYQAADADLTSLAGATGTNTIYYRSGADTWSPVTMGPSMAFSGGVLDAAVGAPNDGAFGIDWNGMTAVPPSSNAVYDALHRFDTDDDGKINVLDTVAGLVKTDINGLVSNAVAGTDYEAALGNPSTNGYVLSSTTAGVRSWIAPGGGGGGSFDPAIDNLFTAAQSITLAPAANTVVNGLLLTDTIAATSGNQQYSPSVQLTGRGFGGSTSQPVDWRIYNVPRQGATNPTSRLMIDHQTNNGGWNTLAWFDSSPFVYAGGIRQGLCYPNANGLTGIHWIAEDAGIGLYLGGIAFLFGSTTYAQIFPQSFRTVSNGLFTWSNSGFDPSAVDTALGRNASGVVEINNGTLGQYRDLYVRHITLQSSGIITGLGTVPTGGTTGQVLRKVSATNYDLEWGTGGGGVSDFLALTDTPDSYAGQGGKLVAVNSGATALEFVVAGGGGNVSSSGTPTNLQYARWTDATHISGVAASTVKTDLALVKGDVGLGNVTNDVQTKAAVVPNTAPTDGQLLVGQTIGSLYNPRTLSGSGATISLSTAGVLTISAIAKASITGAPSGAFVGDTDTQTLTNKRITPRVFSVASSATPTFSSDSYDCADITALAVNITSMTSGLTGTPNNFDKLTYRIKDNGTSRTIAWGASFESSMAVLPLSTVAGKTMTVGFLRNTTSAKWECVAVDIEDAAFASLQTTSLANTAGTTSTTPVMSGLASATYLNFSFTPRVSGKIFFQINGGLNNANASGGAQVQLRYGTGAAPANGAAVSGTAIGGKASRGLLGAGVQIPFSLCAVVTGLVVGTAYWLDVDYCNAATTGSVALTEVSVQAYELP